ncbi:unnamed protein product [Kluyveromyces dobzhanskii CBS 2104]|uniref:WGS project CCBQ000000000 data, contig 00009 n=1 Tax=Kluyveromyces dobzhanskii CBS 2104 TaxID=1427455 RepID=A0A0A8L558_9SACH|nr:unnamed protein product [Kluyveromyces dobzhanskii CBS 2104]
MNAVQLPGFTYDPVKKRYFKEQPGDRKVKKESRLPEGLDKSVAYKEYLECVDALIQSRPLPKPEWFRFQNKGIQLATTYMLPSFISQQGPSDMKIGRAGQSIMLNDSSFRLFELSIDESDDSFKVSFDIDSSANEAITYFKTCPHFTISINRFSDFNFNTQRVMAGGKLKLPEVTDVSLLETDSNTFLLFLSSRAFQWAQYNGSRFVTSSEIRIHKKYGDAISCAILTPEKVLIGFRNGSVLLFEGESRSGRQFKASMWFKSDGPIVSITRTTEDNGSALLLSIGKYPFQKLLLLNRNGKVLSEFQSRYSNLSKNKEILSLIRNEEMHCVLYGKTSETELDMFSLDVPELRFPVNLNWNWEEPVQILDVVSYNRGENVLFPLNQHYIRKRSIANVTFHQYSTYDLDSTRMMVLIRDNNNTLGIREFVI